MKNSLQKWIQIIAALAACILVAGCDDRGFQEGAKASPQKVAGRYFYRWPSEEAEVIVLHDDFNYIHFLFAPGASVDRDRPIYTSKGKWSASYGGFKMWNNIRFTNYYSMFDDQQLWHPVIPERPFAEIQMRWDPSGPKIRYAAESDYIFTRE